MKASKIGIASIGVGFALGAFALVWAGQRGLAHHRNQASLAPSGEGAEREGRPEYIEGIKYFQNERAYPGNSIDWSMYQRLATLERSHFPSSPPIGQVWKFLGPNNLDSPDDATNAGTHPFQGPSPLGGRVNCVAFGPGNTIYAGSATGGFWKGTFGTGNWTEMSNWGQNAGSRGLWPTLACSCCAVDPTGKIIYVGTGDFEGTRPSPPGPMGIMATLDGGSTWFNVDDFVEGVGAAAYEPQVSRIFLDSDTFDAVGNGNVVATTGRFSGGDTTGQGINGLGPATLANYAYTGHLWVSTNQGVSWTKATGAAGSPAPPAAVWSACAISPRSATTGLRYYYAVCWVPPVGGDPTTARAQVWRSDDQGATWHQTTNPFAMVAGNLTNPNQTCLDIACSPLYSDNVYVLSGGDTAIFQSTNGGNAWTNQKGDFPNDTNSSVADPNYIWSQADYDYSLAVTTRTPAAGGPPTDWLFVSLIDVASAVQDGVGNAVWQWQGHSYIKPTVSAALTHNDDHALVFNPKKPGQGLFGNDGGAYGMTLTGDNSTWSFAPFNQALPVEEFYNMAFLPNEATQSYYTGGCQDIGTPFFKSGLATNAANKWNSPTYPGDGGYSVIVPGTPANQFFCGYYLNDGVTLIYSTTNTWTGSTYIGQNPMPAVERGAFIPPMIRNPATGYLLLGTNFLDEWQPAGAPNPGWHHFAGNPADQDVTRGDPDHVRSIATSPGGGYFYTGSLMGAVYVCDTANKWTEIDKAGSAVGTVALPNRSVTSITVDPTNVTHIWVTLSGASGVARIWQCSNPTDNINRTWTPLPINLASGGTVDIPTCCLAVNPANTAFMYVGTDMGVFATQNGGTSWFSMTGGGYGLPPVSVRSIDYQTVGGTTYLSVATFGRGAWEYIIPGGGQKIGVGVGVAGPAP